MEKSKKGSRAMSTAAIFAIIISVVGSLILRVNTENMVMDVLLGLFVFGKFAMTMMFTQGWKVFNHKTILGMPRLLFVFYIIVGTLLVSIFVTSRQFGPDLASSAKNILGFVISASAGLIGTLYMWYAGVNEWMAGGSEYDARMQFKSKGDSDEVTEEKVIKLKNLGVIPS
ncbi:MAG: hypothetical protein H6791_00430 [Candidatus Nomurabacteria bacterium]|nr:MAG: hypothetical protein H6791_00430 [Candidatus Nomurabacteria bacterium]